MSSAGNVDSVPTREIRSAEDAIAVLSALADLVEEGGSREYANQLRKDAEAVATLTALHHEAQDTNQIQQFGKPEHYSELRRRLQNLFKD